MTVSSAGASCAVLEVAVELGALGHGRGADEAVDVAGVAASRRRSTVILMAPPMCLYIRCFNRDTQGVSVQ